MIDKHQQKGAETAEFALIALLFFAVLFAVIEYGRALFVWNALAEATRRGARMAVVCPVGSAIPSRVAIFDAAGGTLASSPIIKGLTPAMVTVAYLNQAGVVEANQTLIRFAEVRITGYVHTLIIPLLGFTVNAPPFATTLPTESLGAVPTNPGQAVRAPSCAF
ncbi:TadE/TadG family type IV pilus assembly protein [Methyloglobulus sp.]|uniref:TadE/TadG family type IV pilus assembly protein n=1 Tax=Methyloglobulus sp. TaxID=2518622 RepID=UPI0039891F7D